MPKIREVLIVPHTHMPDIYMEAHERGIREALRLYEIDRGGESSPAFRYGTNSA